MIHFPGDVCKTVHRSFLDAVSWRVRAKGRRRSVVTVHMNI